MSEAGIILCGGRSSRMGAAKALLPFGPERMLQRVVRLLAEAVDQIVVVAAAEQELPELPKDIKVARDELPYRGPLAGLAGGLNLLAGRADLVYLTGCDVPLLSPRLVRRMFELADDYEAAVPVELSGAKKLYHPLAAVYRTTVRPHVSGLLAADRLRLVDLFQRLRTREVLLDELKASDPGLGSLRNLNDHEGYLAALAEAGFEQ
ncbi:MAG TPA: molybdenum cofactor guanylyltransferase [Pirellulales bacterium]|nr:molybdenum cofactor guanylyltransferase [Pirellulales bacterium]